MPSSKTILCDDNRSPVCPLYAQFRPLLISGTPNSTFDGLIGLCSALLLSPSIIAPHLAAAYKLPTAAQTLNRSINCAILGLDT
ncbi:hypothetical protein AKJ16_DCAP10994 [Drosera capensis]